MLNAKWRPIYENLMRESSLLGFAARNATRFVSLVDSGVALGLLGAKLAVTGATLRATPAPTARRDCLRILFLTCEGSAVAPARIRCYQFAEEMRRRGHHAEVFSFWRDIWGLDGLPTRPYATAERVVTALRAFDRLRVHEFDIIYQQRPMYDLVTSALLHHYRGCRVVFDIDDWIFPYGVLPPLRVYHLLPRLKSLSDTCVVSSHLLQEAVSPYFKRVHLVPTYVDSGAFRPRASRADGPVVFGWNGTLFQDFMADSLKVLIEAFAIAHREIGSRVSVMLEILGQGSYLPSLEQWFRSTYPELPVRTRGWIEPSKMNEHLDGVDVGLYALALPVVDTQAICRNKAPRLIQESAFLRSKSPTKIFEYMAKGIPVISTKVGEAAAFVEDGHTGILCETPRQLADAFVRLALDADLRQRMGSAARSRVEERYNITNVGEQLNAIFAEVVADTADRGSKPITP
jgi:glycosyltransferase involved in cell wall biosynthesis